MSRKITTTVYITEEQQRLLKTLNERSKVPVAEYIRQGIDLVLQANKGLLPGQMELNELPPGHPLAENLSFDGTSRREPNVSLER